MQLNPDSVLTLGNSTELKKILSGSMKIDVQVSSNILVKDLIRYSVDEYNSILQRLESRFYLEDTDEVISKGYELCYPDDEDTGEPDEDLPTFSMDQKISTIGEKVYTLHVCSPDLVIKDQEGAINSHIQETSDVGSLSSNLNSEKQKGQVKRINTLGYLVTTAEEESESVKSATSASEEIIYHKSTNTCCNCIIF